ncbi:putative KH and PIN-domain containing protein [Candidatus Tiddalikarchaeum anstoanum]|nr:putative KH and PIN-domain containing protein [Candidatus Tiddalikarchaeum anstoanum]
MDKKIIKELAEDAEDKNVFIPDISIVIEGLLLDLVNEKKISGTIIIHNAIIDELEYAANRKQTTAIFGIEEIEEVKELEKKDKIMLEFEGEKKPYSRLRIQRLSELNAIVRNLAMLKNATLVTADEVQNVIAKSLGIKTLFISLKKELEHLSIEKFFDENTMSVHLREDSTPKAKKGKPGEWVFEEIKKERLTSEDIEKYAKEIVEKAKLDKNSFVEIERGGSTIIQYRNYRIVITRPPLSDGWEITCVRPVKVMTMKEYNLNEKLYERLRESAEGILVAGAPGNGKSTFCQALATFYFEENKVVKTIESPRDLILPPEITQYSKNIATNEELHDILLLSRPDYTIIDEIRNVQDFELFKDLRLAGTGMVGVIHATNPIDAIQRFVGKIELGMVPSVIDTVIFIEKGQVGQVLELSMTVKVPTGMTEEDLSRPIVEVRDFYTNDLEYEMYTFGEQTVVVPIKKMKKIMTVSPARNIAKTAIEERIRQELPRDTPLKIEMPSDNSIILYIPNYEIAKVIGKSGKNIEKLEKKIGVKIDVRELAKNETLMEDAKKENKESIDYKSIFDKKNTSFIFNNSYAAKSIDFFVDNEFLFTATVSKKGEIKVSNKSDLGQKLIRAKNTDRKITLLLSEGE